MVASPASFIFWDCLFGPISQIQKMRPREVARFEVSTQPPRGPPTSTQHPCFSQQGPFLDPERLSHPQGNGDDRKDWAGAGGDAKAAPSGHFLGPPAPVTQTARLGPDTHSYTFANTLQVSWCKDQTPTDSAQSPTSAHLTSMLQPCQPPHRASGGPHFSSARAWARAAPLLEYTPPQPPLGLFAY